MRFVLPFLALAAFLAVPAAAQDATAAREALAALQAAETRVPSARLTVVVRDRRDEKKPLETASESRKRVEKLPGGSAQGTILFGPEGWLKDLSVGVSSMAPRPIRVRTAESASILRNLMQATTAGKEEAYGRVIRVPLTNPADAVLTRRAGRTLAGINWTSVKTEAETLTLTGTRGEEQHTVLLGRQPAPHVRSWSMTRMLTSPEGRQLEQTYECVATLAENGTGKVLEWMTVGTPINSITLRVTEVQKVEPLLEVMPEQLQLRFPRGTRVVDSRAEVPLEYEQTAEGVNEEELAATAKALAEGRARPGDEAPPFELRDSKGKVTRLEDLKGQVVLIFWFKSDSQGAQQAAPAIQALSNRLKAKGLNVIGLNVAETADPAGKADAFAKKHKWTFPFFVDTGEAMLRYGLVSGVPKIAVVDRKGKLAYAQPGADLEAVTALVEKLIAETP